MNKPYIIPIFVPHHGCPHDCIFCNQKKITNISTSTSPEEVEGIIEEYLSYFWRDRSIEVAFYGGSFTAINLDIQKKLLEIPYKYKEKGIIDRIRISTRPDAIDEEILDNLKNYQVDIIELGVQSLDEEVLISSERGHSTLDLYNAVKLIKSYGFKLGLQMMVGLPMDNMEKSILTAREFIKMRPDLVRIYPSLVIKDTHLAKLYNIGEYDPLTMEEAIETCTRLLILFYLENINVIRVGLQATDNIQLGMDVIAGPFHPAFRQLVDSNIYKLLLDDYLENIRYDINGKTITIEANKSMISSIAGQKSVNTKHIKEKYKIKNISIYTSDISKDEVIIKIGDDKEKINIRNWMKTYASNLIH